MAEFFQQLLGVVPYNGSILVMMLRAGLVYIGALILVRIGDKRFLGRNSAFDTILAIIIGSIASRAVNGSAPMVPTLAAVALLVFVHWVLAWLAFQSDSFGPWIKGQKRKLVENGQLLKENMQASSISPNDLLEAMRSQSKGTELDQLREAYLERSGKISVFAKENKPRIVEVRVEQDVQVVRIEISG